MTQAEAGNTLLEHFNCVESAGVKERKSGDPRQGRTHCTGNPNEAFISGLVSSGVVDLLEVIYIDHEQRHRRLCAPGCGELAIQDFVERAAVGNASQTVNSNQSLEVHLRGEK